MTALRPGTSPPPVRMPMRGGRLMRAFRGCSGAAEGPGHVVDDTHILRLAGRSAVVRTTRNGEEWSQAGRACGPGNGGGPKGPKRFCVCHAAAGVWQIRVSPFLLAGVPPKATGRGRDARERLGPGLRFPARWWQEAGQRLEGSLAPLLVGGEGGGLGGGGV